MQYSIGTVFLVLNLFVLSANDVLACNNGPMARCEQSSSEKSCCAEEETDNSDQCASEKDCCGQNHPGQNCPDKKNGGNCPCGTVAGGSASALLEDYSPALISFSTSSDAALRQAFYFAQHMPEEVYLPIWQPPKLGA